MAKRSPVFIAANVILILINIALIGAVLYQRDDAAIAQQKAMLENAEGRLDERLKLASQIEEGMPALQEKFQSLTTRAAQLEPRLYQASKQATFEEELVDTVEGIRGSGSNLMVQKLDRDTSDETPPLREYTFLLHVNGRMTLLPALSKALYQQSVMCLQTRFAASAPDFSFRKLNMVAEFKCFENAIKDVPKPDRKSMLLPFKVEIVDEAQIDSRLSDLYAQVTQKQLALDQKVEVLNKASDMEAEVQALEKLLQMVDEKTVLLAANKKHLAENLPKLYLRVRNSTLGGAALKVENDTVTFPDYSGEE